METITLKMDESMLKNIDKTLRQNNFSTRTEFIREAIRNYLEKLENKMYERRLWKYLGSAKVRTTAEQNRRTREEVFMEICKERGWNPK